MREEILFTRLEELIKKGEKVHATAKINHRRLRDQNFVDEGLFIEWKTNCLSYLEKNFKDTPYLKNFVRGVTGTLLNSTVRGQAILNALKEDLEKGYLTEYRTLVIADVFADFLEMAEHLIENDYIQPSASLSGAVLEEGLRKICINNKIKVKDNDNISSLNRKLADKQIYTRLIQKQIQVWNQIRDYADHGHFAELKTKDVEEMIKGVRDFLSEYLK